MEVAAPAFVLATIFASVAAVLIFRPLTKRLGEVLLLMQKSRESRGPRGGEDRETARMVALLEQLAKRQELIEERLDFAERLIDAGRGAALPAPGPTRAVRG